MKRGLLLLSCIGLWGCSNTEADFLCEAELGSPCTSIAQADGASSAAVQSVTEQTEDSAMSALSQEPLGIGKSSGGLVGMPDGGFAYESRRYRVPEVIGRLWISPYLDENKILHESRYVHFVVSEARWADR